MPIELKMLVWVTVLALVQLLVSVVGAMTQVPMTTLVGNRETPPAVAGWVGRAQRAHRNMLETLPLFAIFTIVAVMSGHVDAGTAIGAQAFFWARLAYAVIYIVGVPWLRTAVFVVGLAALVPLLRATLAG